MTKSALQKANNMSVDEQSVFGTECSYQNMLEQKYVAAMLSRRLSEKHESYDRAASRLELRGEADAAQVLRRAASRLRTITRQTG